MKRGTNGHAGPVLLPTMLALLFFAVAFGQDHTPKVLDTGTRNAANLWLSWSADGKWLAYTQIELGDPPKFDPDKVSATIVSPDGKQRQQIPGTAMAADFTGDGKSLIITRKAGDKKTALLRYDLDSGQVTPITPTDANYTTPSCSPKGDWVAFSSDRDGDDLQVFLMHKDGSGLKKITQGPGKAYNPNWSADGKRLVYYRELGDQKDQIYSMSPDGSDQVHLSNSDQHNFYPAFLPNGDVSYTNVVAKDQRRVIIVDPSGVLKRVWMYDTAYMKWSPRGGRAAFFAGGFPKSAVYVCNADGSGLVKVSE
jgi:Tol biopolymer transport system component